MEHALILTATQATRAAIVVGEDGVNEVCLGGSGHPSSKSLVLCSHLPALAQFLLLLEFIHVGISVQLNARSSSSQHFKFNLFLQVI